MTYRVTHKTIYKYTDTAGATHNTAHLTPRHLSYQQCRRTDLVIRPTPTALRHHIDYFGNSVTSFAIHEPHNQLTVTAISEVDVRTQDEALAALCPPWEQVRDQLKTDRSDEVLDAFQYVFDSPYISTAETMAAFAEPSFTPGRSLFDAVQDLTHRIYTEFEYSPKTTTLATPLDEVLAEKHGVCQDFAHLQIGCLRSLGLAARYVSGYLRTDPPPGKPRLIGADASHAWLSVFCPGFGWVDFDPTNDCIPSDRHVTLAWGRDYSDVSPVRGIILGGDEHDVEVSVDVVSI